jgi:hypothetical protein
MTALPLEDSKALYDAGIKIETEYVHLIYTDGGSKIIASDSLCLEYYKNERVPAPTLGELLEYAKNYAKKRCDVLTIEWEMGSWSAYLHTIKDIFGENEDLIKALVDLLLKLKEKGYEV